MRAWDESLSLCDPHFGVKVMDLDCCWGEIDA